MRWAKVVPGTTCERNNIYSAQVTFDKEAFIHKANILLKDRSMKSSFQAKYWSDEQIDAYMLIVQPYFIEKVFNAKVKLPTKAVFKKTIINDDYYKRILGNKDFDNLRHKTGQLFTRFTTLIADNNDMKL